MSHCCVGNMSTVDWVQIKKMCAQMHKDMDKAISDLERKLEAEINELDAGKIQTIMNNIRTLNIQINAFVTGQALQDQRLDKLEDECANLELTTSEVLEAYNGA